MPDWATTDHYNVIATTGERERAVEMAAMVRNLLVERFKLATHILTEERDGMTLERVSPNGVPAGLHKLDVDCADPAQRLAAREASARRTSPDDAMPPCLTENGKVIKSGGQAMSTLARLIGAVLEKSVVDETGLDGHYAFNLSACQLYYAPGRECEAPELTTALREQLGLKLVSRKMPVKTLVIDYIARPSEN